LILKLLPRLVPISCSTVLLLLAAKLSSTWGDDYGEFISGAMDVDASVSCTVFQTEFAENAVEFVVPQSGCLFQPVK
jgi:hypothetical protein